MSWSATHRITFAPADGATLKHWLVMLCRDPYSADSLLGVTEDDFRKQRAPTWRFRESDHTWWWLGVPTPLWQPGAVRLTALQDDTPPPGELRYDQQAAAPGA